MFMFYNVCQWNSALVPRYTIGVRPRDTRCSFLHRINKPCWLIKDLKAKIPLCNTLCTNLKTQIWWWWLYHVFWLLTSVGQLFDFLWFYSKNWKFWVLGKKSEWRNDQFQVLKNQNQRAGQLIQVFEKHQNQRTTGSGYFNTLKELPGRPCWKCRETKVPTALCLESWAESSNFTKVHLNG
jgi:hypothetical protein